MTSALLSAADEDRLVRRLREETPGVGHVIHFNNAGCSLPTRSTVAAQVEYMEREAVTGGYELAAANRAQQAQLYEAIASALGARSDEVGIATSATDAWQRMMLTLPLPDAAHIVADIALYDGILYPLLTAQRYRGWRLTTLPRTPEGVLDVVQFQNLCRSGRVDMFAVSHFSAISSSPQPLRELARVAHEHETLVVVDACQAMGHVPIDVSATEIDALVFTGRKYLRAPRGTGGHFLRHEVASRIRPWLMDSQSTVLNYRDGEFTWQLERPALSLENWERNWATQAGFAAALEDWNNLDQTWAWQRIQHLAAHLVERLGDIPRVKVHRTKADVGGIVTFTIADTDPLAVRDELRRRGCNIWYLDSQNAPLQMLPRATDGLLRASVHYHNTTNEIDTFTERLRELLAKSS